MVGLAQGVFLMVAWVFLVLPSCPCQVMSLFGVDLPGWVAVTFFEGGQTVLVGQGEDSRGIPCHCDEEKGKSALLEDVETDGYGCDPVWGAMKVPPGDEEAAWAALLEDR
jgi:hypothetical protein